MTRRRTATPTADGAVPWPEDLAEVYAARGWWRGNALGAELLTVADAHPDAVALVDGPLRMTYRSLAARADGLAAGSLTLSVSGPTTVSWCSCPTAGSSLFSPSPACARELCR